MAEEKRSRRRAGKGSDGEMSGQRKARGRKSKQEEGGVKRSAGEGVPLAGVPSTPPSAERVSQWFKREYDRWSSGRLRLDGQLRDRITRQHEPTHTTAEGLGNELEAVEVRSGVLKTLLREYIGIISGESPRFEALAEGVGQVHQGKADRIEQWVRSWWEYVDAEETMRLVDSDQVLYGRGLSLVCWAPQFWRGKPEQLEDESDEAYNQRSQQWLKSAPVPIMWTHRPASQAVWSDDEYSFMLGPEQACSWQRRSAREVADLYPKSAFAKRVVQGSEEARRDAENQQVLFLCWANRRHIAWLAAPGMIAVSASDGELESGAPQDWELLEVHEHGLGENPYVVQVGERSSDPRLEHQLTGLFDNSLDLVDRLDDAMTQFATLVRRYARAVPTLTRSWPPGELGESVNPADLTPTEVEWQPDRVLQLGLGQAAGWWQPDLSSLHAAQRYAEILNTYIQRDTLAPSTYGSGTATESGFQLVTLIQAGERKLKPLLARKRMALTRAVSLVLKWLVKLGQELFVPTAIEQEGSGGVLVSVGGQVSLTPQLARVARMNVKVNVRLESADAAAAQIGLQIAQVAATGAIDVDPDWVLSRWFGIEQPQRHHEAAELRRFMHQPEVRQFEVQKILDRAGLLLEEEDQQLAESLQGLSPNEQRLIPQALARVLAEEGRLSPQVASLMGAAAPPGPPNPQTAATAAGAPRMPGLGMPPQQQAPVTGDAVNLGLGNMISRAGQPRSPTEAGAI
ncbi:MAG: hypothetical protein CL878_03645 [Dehalococcoidia bacterium]|nr:hypothetical protein [Dehalococcoidia bacterium]